MPKNIIILFIDAVSRARFMKKLSKSTKWFEAMANKDKQEYEMF